MVIGRKLTTKQKHDLRKNGFFYAKFAGARIKVTARQIERGRIVRW
jgi:hypothetical protein